MHASREHPRFDAIGPPPLDESKPLAAPPAVARAMVGILHNGTFIGSGLCVAPKIIITAGHHYNSKVDKVEEFSVAALSNKLQGLNQGSPAAWAQKKVDADVLILWLKKTPRDVYPLRALLPQMGSRVMTMYICPVEPYRLMMSPAIIVGNKVELCLARGTVTSKGCSGAVVIDELGSVVGMHLSSNRLHKERARISEFISARGVIAALIALEIDIARDTTDLPSASHSLSLDIADEPDANTLEENVE